MRFVDDLVAEFEDLLCLPKIGWNSQPHLIDHVEHAFAIHHEVATHRQPASLDYQFLERIDEIEDLHVCPARAHLLLLSVLLAQGSANVCRNEVSDVIAKS